MESITLIPIHNGKGERWAVVGGVTICYSELENTCAFWAILLREHNRGVVYICVEEVEVIKVAFIARVRCCTAAITN